MSWSRSYYSIALLSSVQHPSTRFVKIPPKSHVLVGNRNICDRVVSVRWTPNITSIMSMPIYLWWVSHVRIILSRFSAPCNIRQPDLSKSPPNPMFWSVTETYVIGLYRYVEHPGSHQLCQCPYICDDLVTFVLFYRASQLRATSINPICQNPPNPMFWLVTETYVIGLYRYVEHPISHQLCQCPYICDELVTFVLFYRASQLRATSVNPICQNPPQIPCSGW